MTGRSHYPPIGDYALIGDCHSAALVSRQGSIEWCCLPRFDSGSAFAAMLDRERGGICSITPTGNGSWEYARAYADDTLVLETRLNGPSGWWRRFAKLIELDGPDESGARRSAIALKALTHAPTGAIIAAPTTSVPEVVGGPRNWDYRYAWVRDSSFSSRAFAAVGCVEEADAFRAFVMRSAAGHAGDLQILYGVGGERRISGEELSSLEGYRASVPVRVGNDATTHRRRGTMRGGIEQSVHRTPAVIPEQ